MRTLLPVGLLGVTFLVCLVPGPARSNGGASYPWLADLAEVPTAPLETVVAVPAGFQRSPANEGSLAHWLRHLPVRTDRTDVRAYDGRRLRSPAAHVIALDVGSRDLQQCADTAIRLVSEFAWASGRTEELGWDFTSGDHTRWSDYVDGETFVIHRSVERRAGPARSSDRATFRRWLNLVFTYAGTRSLAREGRPVEGVRPGDIYVAGGSPGHAVVVLDVATHPDGRRAALLGQGFMPAQELHVLRAGPAPASPVLDDVWFLLPTTSEDLLDTPSWAPFRSTDARRITPRGWTEQ